jgi:hypothetical protein
MVTGAGTVSATLNQLTTMVWVRDCWWRRDVTQHPADRLVADPSLQMKNGLSAGR